MKKLVVALFVLAFAATGSALASGTLSDTGVLVYTYPDNSQGWTTMTAEMDGTYVWLAPGGNPGCPLSQYSVDGTLLNTYYPQIDFRSLYASNGGQLYAKEFCGNVYSISQSGVATLLYGISDPDCQSAASLNGDDTELYVFAAPTLYRFDAANGSPIGNVPLIGMGGGETDYPDNVQMETTADGRILTCSNGVVSEWDLAGNRIGQCNVPIGSPGDFNTDFSFGVGLDGLVYLYNANTAQWESYDVGAGGPVAVEETTWGAVKGLFR
ncbi:MAG: hypothetical protein ACE15D_00990 [Candidatus Eisenbacteria bacterium]|nr:hypothetical protein [Candidatus Eisenbacteria bacterium]